MKISAVIILCILCLVVGFYVGLLRARLEYAYVSMDSLFKKIDETCENLLHLRKELGLNE